MMALEIAMDELAEKLGHRSGRAAHSGTTPRSNPRTGPSFSQRNLVRCLREGAERFGWQQRNPPPAGARRDWLVGMGMAAAFRNNFLFLRVRAFV